MRQIRSFAAYCTVYEKVKVYGHRINSQKNEIKNDTKRNTLERFSFYKLSKFPKGAVGRVEIPMKVLYRSVKV